MSRLIALVCIGFVCCLLIGCRVEDSSPNVDMQSESIAAQIEELSQSPVAADFQREVREAVTRIQRDGLPDEPLLFSAAVVLDEQTNEGALAALYVNQPKYRADVSEICMRVVPVNVPEKETVHSFDVINPDKFVGCLNHVGILYEFVDFHDAPEVSSRLQMATYNLTLHFEEGVDIADLPEALEDASLEERKAERLVMILPLSFLDREKYQLFIKLRDSRGRYSNELRLGTTIAK